MRHLARWLAVAACTAAPLVVLRAQPAAPAASSGKALETALDRYVAAPDPHYTFTVVRDLPATGATATLLDVVSQQWLTSAEVEQPVWRHWLTVIRPVSVTSDVALLFISGGSNEKEAPSKPTAWMVDIARDTGTVVAELRLIPNQPIVFRDDPAKKPRFEDDFIAYTWDKYLRTGDERWPARLPMTKAAVRAMDTLTAFTSSPAGGGAAVRRFVVAGASKRGWTTWAAAAVDRRVVAIAPVVIDVLNVERSFVHHWRAYGAWAEAVQDYVDHRIMDWMGTPQFARLMAIEDPYSYRARYTMPKLVLNAAGDEFFLPDSSQFYLDALPGETHLRYVPNTGHGLEESDAIQTLHAFYAAIVANRARPSFRWTFEADGSIRVVAKDRPTSVTVWQATNTEARDFRIDKLGPKYTSTTLAPAGPNTWVARLSAPPRGWTAGFVELAFDTGAAHPLKLTTATRVLPDALPFGPPPPGRVPHSTGPAPVPAGAHPQERP